MSENTDYETLEAEYIELDKNYRAVAAENMLLKVAARDMLSGWKAIRQNGGESEIYGIGWDRSQSAVESALNTPATTQAINEIKAQGVEEQVSRLEGEYGELDDVCVMVFRDLREFAAARDGECHHKDCPQIRDNEPTATGRHCPIDNWDDE
ncbi:hypothetical protein [Yersinia massiliensis]|uniref:Uncharacterized protein n=1 Tax=Yersinia massiliensis TaxID=419257 RepID=A0ABM6UTA9_9GAMM|nr:hypothetical protein [Yersinia massiliensis]AVX37785.1 hypothetical protein DA391_09000 [Yersinia massiliensis]